MVLGCKTSNLIVWRSFDQSFDHFSLGGEFGFTPFSLDDY
jgi:hypothetical protein